MIQIENLIAPKGIDALSGEEIINIFPSKIVSATLNESGKIDLLTSCKNGEKYVLARTEYYPIQAKQIFEIKKGKKINRLYESNLPEFKGFDVLSVVNNNGILLGVIPYQD